MTKFLVQRMHRAFNIDVLETQNLTAFPNPRGRIITDPSKDVTSL